MVEIQGEKRFDRLMSKLSVTDIIDFCSIDIDGLDVEMFEAFEKFMLKVIAIEGGQVLPPSHPRVPQNESLARSIFPRSGCFQC